MSSFISPMLATLTDKYFSDPHWIYEEKFDGVRCIAIKKNGKVTLYSRNQKILDHVFPEILEELTQKKSKNYIVDGEIVTLHKGISSFSRLQGRLNVLDTTRIKGKKVPVVFYLFDLLQWNGEDLRGLLLIERKNRLKTVFPFTANVRYTPHVVEKGEVLLKKAKHRGWEGIIAKRADSKYVSKRSRDWLKFKCSKGQEFVIVGFTDPQRSRIGFGALLVGYYERGKLFYAGKVGTGFDTEMLQTLGKKLRSLEIKQSPLVEAIREKNVHYIKPILVGEVGFTEWTSEGKLRHPRFLGLRKDKSAKEVVREKES